jgi:hypothetical protein
MSKRPTLEELLENYGRAVYAAELHQRRAALIRQQIDSFAQDEANSFYKLTEPDAPADTPHQNFIPPAQQVLSESSKSLDLNTVRMRLTRSIQARVARALGVSRCHVSMVVNGHRTSAKVSNALKREYAAVEAQLAIQFPALSQARVDAELAAKTGGAA